MGNFDKGKKKRNLANQICNNYESIEQIKVQKQILKTKINEEETVEEIF